MEGSTLKGGERPAAPDESPAWAPPPEFGPFRLGPELGHGAMGVVYRALNLSVGREVALKFIASSQPGSRVEEFFHNEARILATLNHANIVTLYSVGEVDGHPYIETELIQGQSLTALPRPLLWDQVLELGLGLAQGLAAAHRQHVLHRDIKPSNAMATGGGGVKLLDFGLAEHFDPDAPQGSGGVAGTLLYMAPECADGAPATERSDLYSLGAVLFQLCSDRVPLENARLGPDVNRNLAAVIERCIRSDPNERYASAELLVRALKTIQPISHLDANPYRGLAAFEAEHQALFFGRGDDIQKVLDRLAGKPMVLVAAESGVGKSSLCRAGVLPRAEAGQLVKGRAFTVVTLAPGRRPLEALAAALAPVLRRIPLDEAPAGGEVELFTRLADEPARLGRQLGDAFRAQGGLLLFVDQLEELVTLSESAERDAFAGALQQLARPAAGVRVLLAVRGDFFTRVASLPGLSDEAERALYLLRPMSPSGLREAIVAPARACGVSFESEALVQDLVDTTAHGTGNLPLLSFALAELYERRDRAGARITRASLDALGGVEGMLSRHADGVVAHLDAEQTREARRLLVRLITAERTRIERGTDELGVGSPAAQVALRSLIDGRLLQVRAEGGHVLYQITHDSLIHAWPKLVGWLDDDVGQTVVRKRLETAAAEWRRTELAPEALWPKRQLDEARGLDPSTLTPEELEFLGASRRRVTRRKWLRRLAAVLAAAAIGAPYGGFRFQQWREEVDFVTSRQATARGQLKEARDLSQEACTQRKEALQWFDPPRPDRPQALPAGAANRWHVAEDRWAAVLALYDQAETAYGAVEKTLQGALDRQYQHGLSRRMLSEAISSELELEECFHPQGEASPAVRHLMDRLGDGAEPVAPGEVKVVTEPAGANVEISRYVEADGRLDPKPVPPPGDRSRFQLPPGSYLLHFSAPGRSTVALPLLLAPGQRESVRLALPAKLPDGMVYVPPGCFLAGSDNEVLRRDLLGASPLHQVCMERGYLVGRTEITFGDWIQYLESLPPSAEARHLLESLSGPTSTGLTLHWERPSGWTLSYFRSGKPIFSASEGEDFRYEARTQNATGDWRLLPLSSVSSVDLEGYFAWLDRSGRLPGARLCTEMEWERAARGADARGYPSGDSLQADDANFDETYGRKPNAYGPDTVGSHRNSASPFGVLNMAGNAQEMVIPLTPEQGSIVLKGGHWYFPRQATLIANRGPGEPTMRELFTGARTCAPAPDLH
ncbi:MAG TPA: protein kinase [Myxococcaceae bacterium]